MIRYNQGCIDCGYHKDSTYLLYRLIADHRAYHGKIIIHYGDGDVRCDLIKHPRVMVINIRRHGVYGYVGYVNTYRLLS